MTLDSQLSIRLELASGTAPEICQVDCGVLSGVGILMVIPPSSPVRAQRLNRSAANRASDSSRALLAACSRLLRLLDSCGARRW